MPATVIDRIVTEDFTYEKAESALDDAIDDWHHDISCVKPLHVHLGMTLEEYGTWMTQPKVLATIIKNRRSAT